MASDQVRSVVDLITSELAEELATCEEKPFGYDSLALAIVDAVYSLRARYAGVVNVIARYREARREDGADPNADGVPELRTALAERGAAALFRNGGFAPGTSRRKDEVIASVAEKFDEAGIRTRDDFNARVAGGGAEEVRALWTSEKGLGKISWHYLVMLMGNPDVKTDLWIHRFLDRALGASVSDEEARQLITEAAGRLGVATTALDHMIWTTEQQRDSSG